MIRLKIISFISLVVLLTPAAVLAATDVNDTGVLEGAGAGYCADGNCCCVDFSKEEPTYTPVNSWVEGNQCDQQSKQNPGIIFFVDSCDRLELYRFDPQGQSKELEDFLSGSDPSKIQGAAPGLPDLKKTQELAAKNLNPLGINAPSDLISRGINLLMAFIGSIALVLYIVSGFIWMSAGGNSEKVSRAKSIMVWTTLGIIAMAASYMIMRAILERIG